jgi:hypothetical protein
MAGTDEHIYDALGRIETKLDETLAAHNALGNRVTQVEATIWPDKSQPSVITALQSDVQSLRESRTWLVGALAAIEFIGHWSAHKLGMK